MPLIYQSVIYRQDLRRNPQILYVFGDNTERRGLRGQAAEMRGEPNAVGIATKWRPTLQPDAFFYDNQMYQVLPIWTKDLTPIAAALEVGRIVVWPLDGIGSGLSKLPQNAPRLWSTLEDVREQLAGIQPAS